MAPKAKKLFVADDFVRTIDDDEELPDLDEPDDEAPATKGKSKSQLRKEQRQKGAKGPLSSQQKQQQQQSSAAKKSSLAPPDELNPDFAFDADASFSANRYANAWDFTSAKAAIGKSRHAAISTIDEKIERVKKEAVEKKKKSSAAVKKSSASSAKESKGNKEVAKTEKKKPEKEVKTDKWTSEDELGSGDVDVELDESDADLASDDSNAESGSENGSFVSASDSEGEENEMGESEDGEDEDEDEDSDAESNAESNANSDAAEGIEVNDDFGSDAEDDDASSEENETDLRPLVSKKTDESDDEDTGDIIMDKKKSQFFEMPDIQPQQPGAASDGISFTEMNLSRPIMRAIASLGYTAPTQIQQHAIPTAMLGKDICGSAVTGSGKTAAFIIPILERLLFRPKNPPQTRVLVLVPTRELGIQCHSVATNLAKYTDIKCALCVGGLSSKTQEAELRKRPDIVIATPGRLIDHVRNSMDFTLDSIEILVIDEADRILEDGFKDELAEIISFTSKTRQTMLFSATMTDSVDDLVKLSLNRPVRLFVNNNRNLASGLVQEFIRIRAGKNDSDRAAILAALVMRTYKSETIIFFGSKAGAHQMKIVFGLLGLKAAELHGDLTQLQRLEALEMFRDHKVDFLLATDLASRGLDIAGIKTVINYDMPRTYQQYVHRVGRTARAKADGRSVSLVTEADRKILKEALKNTHEAVKNRIIPPAIVQKYKNKVESFRDQIKEILEQEKEEKELARADMEATKAENLINHAGEIAARPARTWFQSEQQKKAAKVAARAAADGASLAGQKRKASALEAPKRDKMSGLTRRKKRRLEAVREMNEEGLGKAAKLAARHAKAQVRPTKLSAFADPLATRKPAATPSKKKRDQGKDRKGGKGGSPGKKKPFMKGGKAVVKSKARKRK